MRRSASLTKILSCLACILSIFSFLLLAIPDDASSQEVVILLEKLSSPKKEERLEAAVGLLKHNFDIVHEKVLPIYRSEQDKEVKEALGMVLGGFGDPEVLDLMIKYAQGEDLTKREYAIKALGKIGDKKASPVLLMALSDQNPKIKRQALIALTRIREEKAIPLILKLMPEFPEDVKKSVSRFGVAAKNTFIGELTSDLEEVRKLSVDGLLALADLSVIPDMMEAAEKNKYVLPAIRQFGAEAVPYILPSLRSKSLFTRELAAFLLGEFQDPQAIPSLVEALADTPENAPLALVKFEDKATSALIAGLKNKETGKLCASLLGEIGSSQAIEPLIEAAASGEEEPVNALILIGRPAVVVLNKYVRSTNAKQRRAVATVIGQIGDPRSISILLSAAKDPDLAIKKDAIYALGLIGYRPAAHIIVKELENSDPGIREESRVALVRYGKEYLTQKLEEKFPTFIKRLNLHLELVASREESSGESQASEDLESDEEPSPLERIIRNRIRLFESLTFTKDAINTFDELRKEAVLTEKDHYHLARLYRQIGKKRRMLEELQKSLTINPNYEKALIAVKKLGYEYKHGRLRQLVK
jgi:HEAT repeat protein